MARHITQRELRNQSGEIMRGLDRGEAFVVTRNGVPVGELIPLQRPLFVPMSALRDAVTRAGHVDYLKLRRDLAPVFDDEYAPRS